MRRVESTIAGLAVAAAFFAAAPAPARAQTVDDSFAARVRGDGKSRLLVEAKELLYDNDRNTVSAVGEVELNYQGRTLQADKVTYDRTTGRVLAVGNARLTEADGTVLTAGQFELTDDFKSGFIDSLRLTRNSLEKNRPVTSYFSAPRAERVGGETTVFERGTFTVCEPCEKDPERPPLWQVKAARIIHNNAERTIYYENATVELAGIPIAYIPYFWTPDPTVRRKTGLLTPSYFRSSSLGHGVTVPFFLELAPNYDLTFRPTYFSRQGFFANVEWRHRLLTGAYNVRATGIFQKDQNAFLPGPLGPREREARGSLESAGLFYINDKWKWGWDVALLSDKWYLNNYRLNAESLTTTFFRESTSTLFLQGKGDRSWFDLRGYYFKALSSYDWQKQQPVVHPSLDYNKRFNGPQPLGGEVSIDVNVTSLSREAAHFTQIPKQLTSLFTFKDLSGNPYGLYESCAIFDRSSCLLRGIAGTTSRVSAQVAWRRNFVDAIGQVWTPFAYARVDGFYVRPDTTGYINQYVANFISPEDQVVGRAMPAIGLQYRYPFVADAGSLGVQTIEPIAQVIARPNEARIGRLPNEDAHSVIFDDTSLFSWDRFSGYDRAEGGVRADLGIKYSILSNDGFYADAVFGQSYHLAGRNSFATADLVNAGRDTSLDEKTSDYVGRVHVQPFQGLNFTTRARFDKETFNVTRFDGVLSGTFNPILPVTATLLYANYAPQPGLGFDRRREGLVAAAQMHLTPRWSVSGSVQFDLSRYLVDRENFLREFSIDQRTAVYKRNPYFNAVGVTLGAQYEDECTTFGVSYFTGVKDSAVVGATEPTRTLTFRLELRTLGGTSLRQTVAGNAASSTDGVAQ